MGRHRRTGAYWATRLPGALSVFYAVRAGTAGLTNDDWPAFVHAHLARPHLDDQERNAVPVLNERQRPGKFSHVHRQVPRRIQSEHLTVPKRNADFFSFHCLILTGDPPWPKQPTPMRP